MELRLLTESQAAGTLGLKAITLRRWRWKGEGPDYIKIGRSVRYDPETLRDFIEAGRRSSTSSQPYHV